MDIDVSPGSASRGIRGYDEWRKRIKISVKAQAKDGKANAELVSLLSEILGAVASNIQITSGHTSGRKRVLVKDISKELLMEKLGEHLGP